MSYRALYRKYRPRLFSDIVGQPGIVQALAGQVASGRVSHAYLFSGPRGTGKTSAAKVLARAINCADNQHGEACGKCRPCTELMSDTNMDVVEIDAASNNSVDRVREMLDNVKYMPAVGKYRVYIVDEVHMLSVSAFNALLKTLEEPPAHVVFILATTEPHKLPPTVLSRCQQFQFRRISTGDMTALLEGVLKSEGATADREALTAIARAADGGMRDALSLLDQCLSLNGSNVSKRQVLDMLGASDSATMFDVAGCALSGDAGTAVGLLDGFINGGGDIKTFAVDLCRHMRDLFIAAHVKDAAAVLDATADESERLSAQARRHSPGDILRCLQIFSELEGGLRYAANPRVLVELALFRCCRTEKAASYDALLSRVERLEARLDSGGAARPAAPARSQPPAMEPRPAPEPHAGKTIEPASTPAVAVPEADFEVPWFEDAPPAGENDVPATQDVLPGQADLFSGMPEEPSSRSKREPEAAPGAAAPAMPPTKLWSDVLKVLDGGGGKSPLLGFAQKGKATAFDGNRLTLTFSEEGKGAANMLSEEKRKRKLAEAVESITGNPVEIIFEVSRWSEKEQKFIRQSMDTIPKGIQVEIDNNF